MSAARAYATLDLEPDADPTRRADSVRRAYVRAVLKDHPDHGGDGTRLATLQAARDTLLSHSAVSPCILCRGSGKVRARFGAQTCTACEGSGDQRP